MPELLQDTARGAVEAGADTIVCKLIGDEKKKKKAGRGEEAESKAAASSYECKGKHAMPEFKTPSAHYECDGCGKKNLPKVRKEGREKKGREEIRRLKSEKRREEKRIRGGERKEETKTRRCSLYLGSRGYVFIDLTRGSMINPLLCSVNPVLCSTPGDDDGRVPHL